MPVCLMKICSLEIQRPVSCGQVSARLLFGVPASFTLIAGEQAAVPQYGKFAWWIVMGISVCTAGRVNRGRMMCALASDPKRRIFPNGIELDFTKNVTLFAECHPVLPPLRHFDWLTSFCHFKIYKMRKYTGKSIKGRHTIDAAQGMLVCLMKIRSLENPKTSFALGMEGAIALINGARDLKTLHSLLTSYFMSTQLESRQLASSSSRKCGGLELWHSRDT